MRTPYRRNFRRPQQNTNRRYYATNLRIEAPELRVIRANGEQIGVMSRQDALHEAQTQGVDLVLIAEKAQPPVAKLIDFKKFLYQEEKKAKEAKKGIKKSIVKDIKLSLFIAPGDKERLLEKGREFLEDGNQLRLNLTLRGREVTKKEMAIQMMTQFITNMGEVTVAKPPTLEGRVVRSVVSRKK